MTSGIVKDSQEKLEGKYSYFFFLVETAFYSFDAFWIFNYVNASLKIEFEIKENNLVL